MSAKVSSQTRARNAGISSIEILSVGLNLGCSNEEAAEFILAKRAEQANCPHSARTVEGTGADGAGLSRCDDCKAPLEQRWVDGREMLVVAR